MDDVKYVGSRKNLPEGFAMIIPQGPFRPPKKPWFKVWKEYDYWHMKVRMPGYPKWLDKMLRPLCRYGLHRWVGTFSIIQYSYGPPKTTNWEVKREQNFSCSRCKKTKTKPQTPSV